VALHLFRNIRGKIARLRETILVVPNLKIEICDGKTGKILDVVKTHNLITDSGLDHLRNLIGYPDSALEMQGATPNYIALGTGTTAVDPSDDMLENEVFRGEISARAPLEHGIEFYLSLGTDQANGYDLTEAGIFHVNDGIIPLWSRAVHAAISKTASVAVNYRWSWTFGVP
jgi:hypothetical protein